MMSRYPLPGVYTQDIIPAPRPALRTGIVIFLAYCPFMMDTEILDPSEIAQYTHQFFSTPVEINNELGFKKAFPFAPDDTFTEAALYGFFRNGGTACYVLPMPAITYEAIIAALAILDELEDGDLLCIPDLMWAYQQQVITLPDVLRLQGEILAHCARMTTRFAILDAVNDVQLIMEQRQALIQMAGRYGALYYPWIMPSNSKQQQLPPSGHIAGTYARADYARGVHKAPANEIIEDVLDVSHSLSKREQGQFIERQMNYILAMRGRGIRAWGAYTLSTDADWKYVTTSRLF
ncbi:MAG: phage tail sheath subtilisin-like domain-containing protein, partial [Phototrophicaceae bacterium]